METAINLQIILTQPPPNVLFGLQKGSGTIYETVQKQMSASQDLLFTFPITIKGDKGKDAFPKFSGPFVQGPAGGKFIYIDIGQCAGQFDTAWSRRLKSTCPPPRSALSPGSSAWRDVSDVRKTTQIMASRVGPTRDIHRAIPAIAPSSTQPRLNSRRLWGALLTAHTQ